jgi:hypothetical protein
MISRRFGKPILSLVAAAAFALVNVQPSLAAGYHAFKITNDGYHVIVAVYLSDSTDKYWGPNQLDAGQTIPPGNYVSWDWSGDCNQDMKIVFGDGHVDTVDELDTCSYDWQSTY